MIKIIASVSKNGVIGVDNKLPFDYPADMKHFRTVTSGCTIIMGRKTFESIGRSLPKRRNLVISSRTVNAPGIETFSTITHALATCEQPYTSEEPLDAVWLIGGAGIYQEGMEHAQEIHLTLTPDIIRDAGAVRFPWINPLRFQVDHQAILPGDTEGALKLVVYTRFSSV